jgi:hypothetical protein
MAEPVCICDAYPLACPAHPWNQPKKDRDELVKENERLAEGICDALKHLDGDAKMLDEHHRSQPARAILRGLLTGTKHEGHRVDPHYYEGSSSDA